MKLQGTNSGHWSISLNYSMIKGDDNQDWASQERKLEIDRKDGVTGFQCFSNSCVCMDPMGMVVQAEFGGVDIPTTVAEKQESRLFGLLKTTAHTQWNAATQIDRRVEFYAEKDKDLTWCFSVERLMDEGGQYESRSVAGSLAQMSHHRGLIFGSLANRTTEMLVRICYEDAEMIRKETDLVQCFHAKEDGYSVASQERIDNIISEDQDEGLTGFKKTAVVIWNLVVSGQIYGEKILADPEMMMIDFKNLEHFFLQLQRNLAPE